MAKKKSKLPLGDLPKVTIYSDGAAKGNPGKGGYGSLLIWNDEELELCECYRHTTNNRMELLGLIAALEELKVICEVQVFTDSKYIVDTLVNKWYTSWKRNGWRTRMGDPVKNKDLWQRLIHQVEMHKVMITWVKGHAGNVGNERVDKLANLAISTKKELIDTGFDLRS
jgi:ribonuclease HI